MYSAFSLHWQALLVRSFLILGNTAQRLCDRCVVKFSALVNGTVELSRCLILCTWMAVFWVLRYVLHSISTSLSHHATFYVLSNTRIRLLDKLAALPLGAVLDRSSGAYKNIIVERVDSIETTLAHLLPEMTAALAVLAVLFLEDWRMGFSMLIVVPLGILCFMSMFRGYSDIVAATEVFRTRKLDSEVKIPLDLKIQLAVKLIDWYDNTEAKAYVKKMLTKGMRALIDSGNLGLIQVLLEKTDLITKKNVDKYIQYAIDTKQQEIYLTLIHYKDEVGAYTEISKKFRL